MLIHGSAAIHVVLVAVLQKQHTFVSTAELTKAGLRNSCSARPVDKLILQHCICMLGILAKHEAQRPKPKIQAECTPIQVADFKEACSFSNPV